MGAFLRILATCLAAIPAIGAGQATDAVAVDPDVHRVVLENEAIRVFDARASKGAKSPMHTHPPMVLVSLGSTRLRMALPDGKTALFDLDPGKTAWVEGAHHGWEILAGDLRAVGVEIKSAQAGKVPPAPQRKANDAVATDPDAHHLLFENPHVRVFEGRTSIGRRSPMHSHPASAMVSLDWMRLKLTLPDGKTAIHDFSPGQVLWLENGGEHSWEAIAGGGRVIVIEVKSAQGAAPAG